jgi:hypothetical protein
VTAIRLELGDKLAEFLDGRFRRHAQTRL